MRKLSLQVAAMCGSRRAAAVVAITIAVAQDNKPIAGIGPAGAIVQAHTGFKFTEGPAADAQGNVYFADIPNGRIHRVDTAGNLYLTQPSLKALQVVSPDGRTLGLITFPEGPANCTFGGPDMKTLYVTARTSLYTVKMEATGHRFAAQSR